MDRALLLVALACYLAPLLSRDDGRLRVLAARWWVPAGILLHVQGLALAFILDSVPLRSMTEGLGLTALTVMLAREWFGRRPRMGLLRRILLALASVLLGLAAVAPSPEGAGAPPSIFFLLHIGLVLTGFAAFALTFSMSALFLVVRRRLKSKDLSEIGRLPSLDTLDVLVIRTMAFGFACLTAGIAGGLALGLITEGKPPALDFTTIVTTLLWLWYAAGLVARVAAGWRGRLVAVFGVGGFVAFMVVAGVGLALSGWHGMGA
ncbi:MAG: cytochrome c biogenesis protein CcsA [Alphaproteobacteria bacterium]|nr:cytochrome c biogenesis protein CcsA [Alphaproteobacteria bacterium]